MTDQKRSNTNSKDLIGSLKEELTESELRTVLKALQLIKSSNPKSDTVAQEFCHMVVGVFLEKGQKTDEKV